MKRLSFLALAAGVLFLAGCSGGSDDDTALFLTGSLSGANEVPANTATGTGTTQVTVNDDGTMRVQVNATGLSGTAIGAHIHVGVPGVNGGIVTNLLTDGIDVGGPITNSGGTLTIDRRYPSAPAGLAEGTHYINVHTNAINSGEIRANLSED